jgi:tRNA threonylcarbamoyladenosine biosynthesis protein TsaE
MGEVSLTFHTASGKETVELGQRLGKALESGDVVALAGELGSGKTWFTKGIALGLEVPSDTIVTSPSFSLVNEYQGRCPLFHMDAYRLEQASDFFSVGLEDYFYQGGVVVLEWADRWPEILPDWKLKVEFVIIDTDSRTITLGGNHPRVEEILRCLEKGARGK